MSIPQQPHHDPSAPSYAQPYAGQAYPPPAAGNGAAVAALILGICGFVLTPIPLFIGLFLGGIPAVLGIIFGIVGLVRASKVQRGFPLALIGLILGGLAFLSIFIGAGTIW
jgi:hypothetical protein